MPEQSSVFEDVMQAIEANMLNRNGASYPPHSEDDLVCMLLGYAASLAAADEWTVEEFMQRVKEQVAVPFAPGS